MDKKCMKVLVFMVETPKGTRCHARSKGGKLAKAPVEQQTTVLARLRVDRDLVLLFGIEVTSASSLKIHTTQSLKTWIKIVS